MKKNGKLSVSLFLTLLVLLALSLTAWAEEYDYTDNLQGSYILPGDLTVSAEGRLLADTLTIPANVTLTVNGSATVNNALVIEQGGALVIGENARFELNNFRAAPTASAFNGTITMGNDAALYLGLGHWDNTDIKNTITVSGQSALINVNYRHTAGSPKTVDEMLEILTAEPAAAPAALEPYVRKQFSLCVPYEATSDLIIPDGIEFRVQNNGSDETGSLTISQGAVLTVPQDAYMKLLSADLTVNGTVENSGVIELMTYRYGSEGAMSTLTMGSGAVYQGNGQVIIDTLENPLSYLVGFDDFRKNELWRDESGNQISYQLLQLIYDYTDNLQGSYTLSGNLTVSAEGRLLADTLTIPANVTLTVNGSATVNNALVIEQGGALVIGENARFELNNFRAAPTASAFNGTITMGNDAALYLGLGHWDNTDIKNTITVSGQSALINVNYRHTAGSPKTVDEMLEILTAEPAAAPAALEPYVRKQFSLCVPYEATSDLIIPDGIEFRVQNNGSDETGSLTISQGADVRLSGYVSLVGGSFTNNGTLTVDESAEISIRNPDSTVVNNGSLLLFGDIRGDGEGASVENNGDFAVMNWKAIPAEILFSPNLYHYPDEHRLVLPASVTNVETEAFANVSAWEIVLPETIESIGDRAFADSDDLLLIVIPNDSAVINGNPFENSSLARIAAPSDGQTESFADSEGIPFVPLY